MSPMDFEAQWKAWVSRRIRRGEERFTEGTRCPGMLDWKCAESRRDGMIEVPSPRDPRFRIAGRDDESETVGTVIAGEDGDRGAHRLDRLALLVTSPLERAESAKAADVLATEPWRQ